jgi:hypothetical protein
MLIVHVCSLWYPPSVKVNYCFIVLGICYHFVKRKPLCVAVYHCVGLSVCHRVKLYKRMIFVCGFCVQYKKVNLNTKPTDKYHSFI